MNEIIIEGVKVTLAPSGCVVKMSDWDRLWEFEDKGYFTHKLYPGDYGHVDHFISDTGLDLRIA
jgi:hypothetical protein